MENSKVITVEKQASHPLEDVFGITPGTTIIEQTQYVGDEPVTTPAYDDKDVEIDNKFAEIYNVAMGTAATLSSEVEIVEGKFKARLGEVSASMLMVALNAAKEQASVKTHKDKLKPTGSGSRIGDNNSITNNVIVADRNDLLRTFMQENGGNIIDGDR